MSKIIIMIRNTVIYLLVFMLALSCPRVCVAGEFPKAVLPSGEREPRIAAGAAILAETSLEKVLYAKNIDQKMYPASLTKIMTALIALEYLDPPEAVTVGAEIESLPGDASRTRHKPGETITVENLIRALFLSSGNDSACVLAQQTAARVTGNEEIIYPNAERVFCGLMTEKAKNLGALNTNFVNPHGYHNSRQFTTAYDMMLISREALKNPLINKIARETSFKGNGAGPFAETAEISQDYEWETTNLLLPGMSNAYANATGIRTGQTDEAGMCLAASAEKDGRFLICVTLNSTDPERWTDTAALFEYGFNNFGVEVIQEKGEALGEIGLANVPIGAEEYMPYYGRDEFVGYMSKKQKDGIQKFISFDTEFIYVSPDESLDAEIRLAPPIQKGDVIGKVSYVLNDVIIFTGEIEAGADAEERTFNTDADHYMGRIKAVFFSKAALPYWIIAFLVAGIAIRVIFVIRKNLREKNKGYKIRW